MCAPAIRNSLVALAVLAALEMAVLAAIIALNRSRRGVGTFGRNALRG